MRRRREQRLSKLAAVAIIGTVVLCGFSTWERDTAERQRRIADYAALYEVLSERLDATDTLPGKTYLDDAGVGRLADRYISDAGRTFLRELPEPVMVACGPIIRQYLRYNGRVVIVYRGGKLHLEWWNSGPTGTRWSEQAAAVAARIEDLARDAPDLP